MQVPHFASVLVRGPDPGTVAIFAFAATAEPTNGTADYTDSEANDSDGILWARQLFEDNNAKNEFSYAGLDLASFEFDDLTKGGIPKTRVRFWRRSRGSCATNRAEDWTPTEVSRKYKMFERLDPDFYAAVRLASRLEKIEAAIKFQKVGGASASLPWNKRGKGLDGFRAGSSPTPPVGFAIGRTGVPSLFAIVAAEKGRARSTYHGWKECPNGGKRATGGTAAYDGEGVAEAMHTLALCQIFQVVADDGAEAFAAAVAEYGAAAAGYSRYLTRR
ncbi:hypothetical protein CYMTET_52969 [Cymbomonas tetramitiformis]|uniref:Uncharacterized protein n=1 Tax=Cymbomonas tetramitiformis TaxID=36881 RepID=A0AAE0ES76_9CHLO|nr:hypothetical protein CYMTET_52969 [Cymbomonas tetramitiformis]